MISRILNVATLGCILATAARLEHCKWLKYPGTGLIPSFNSSALIKVVGSTTVAKKICEDLYDCKIIIHANGKGNYIAPHLNLLLAVEKRSKRSDYLWMRVCANGKSYTNTEFTGQGAYYQPVFEESLRESGTIEGNYNDIFGGGKSKVSTALPRNRVERLHHNYAISARRIALPHRKSVEGRLRSWCTYSDCFISPRTYLHAVATDRLIVGFTNDQGHGTLLLLNGSLQISGVLYPKIADQHGQVAGIYGFHDGKFAVAVYVPDEIVQKRRMYLQMYRNDSSVEWVTEIHSAIGVPERNVGDFRLTYGEGYFAVYFSIYGTSNFANGTYGEQLSFVNERGELVIHSFKLDGQEFVRNGFRWGCSHSLGGLIDVHPIDNQFFRICASDLFPNGVATGDPNDGTLLFEAKASGYGYTSAQIGQIAPSQYGWQLIFNAMDFKCCDGKGVGIISIYNERDDITGDQSFDDVVWITETNGKHERDPVIARFYPDGPQQRARERYLIGWHNVKLNLYFIATIDTFGRVIEGPLSSVAVYNKSFECSGDCLKWGNRDDSFRTLPDGSVGWVSAEPMSASIVFHRVSPITARQGRQWSLWSGWSMCSISCGGGIKSRIRTCLHNKEKTPKCTGDNIQVSDCNTKKCKVPVVCEFTKLTPDKNLIGYLYVNQEIQFGYSRREAEEKCKLLRSVCWGYALEYRDEFPFYVLKTSTKSHHDEVGWEARLEDWRMECSEWRGWSHWSTWYSCSVTCGKGAKHRSRFCDGDKPGSVACRGADEESTLCDLGPCPTWGGWTVWSPCSTTCNEGIRRRERKCLNDYSDDCSTLPDLRTEIRLCSRGKCPTWGQWTMWGSCDKTCDSGNRIRTRQCVGDFNCPGDEPSSETQPCSLGSCAFWQEWSHWSACTVSCGSNGIRKRSRDCGGDFPEQCHQEHASEVKACSSFKECPTWLEWSTWSQCSNTCGDGNMKRVQTCSAATLTSCNAQSATYNDHSESNINVSITHGHGQFVREHTAYCTKGICSYWKDWSTWGACSTTCNTGRQKRLRTCHGDFPEDCLATGEPLEHRVCSFGTCGVWSSWSSWGMCSTSCGDGIWNRSRVCEGDIAETCQGSSNAVETCNVADCVPQCEIKPCNNSGRCRYAPYLSRLYRCECQEGWIGKRCDYAGPSIKCEKDKIDIEFDGRALTDEMLVARSSYVALSGHTDTPECGSSTYLRQPGNNVTVFKLTIPAPLDRSCGSDITITEDDIRIKNRIEWAAEDGNIRARVIMLEFTCIYETTSTETAMSAANETPLKVSTFKRSVGIKYGTKDFNAEINLYRDPNFSQPLRRTLGNFLQLAEGQIVYLSVTLVDANVGVETGAKLVMKTCFVTAPDQKRDKQGLHVPILYLLKDRCPTSPFVKVISNGESESGRLSLRIFGWSQKSTSTDSLYLHCTVEICQKQNARECVPDCTQQPTSRSKRAVHSEIINKQSTLVNGMKITNAEFKQYPILFSTVRDVPLISIAAAQDDYFGTDRMVSAGPITVRSLI